LSLSVPLFYANPSLGYKSLRVSLARDLLYDYKRLNRRKAHTLFGVANTRGWGWLISMFLGWGI
jgi:hypothetical protein